MEETLSYPNWDKVFCVVLKSRNAKSICETYGMVTLIYNQICIREKEGERKNEKTEYQ